MEDEVISKIYQDLDTGIAPLCYYNIEITPDSQQSANFSTELSRTTIFTRLLVSGRAHTERCKPTRRSGALGSNRWRLEGFFPIPSTSTSFALYVGYKNPAEEGILLEAKVHPSGFAPGGYTWDIVGSKFLHGTFNITLTVHVWKVRPWGRTEITYDSKVGMPRLRMIPTSDSSSEFLDEEQEFLLTLLESHWSRTSADALILNGLCLFSQSEDCNRAQYLDLAIRALSTGLAYTQDPSPRPHPLRIFFCHLLFIRCDLIDGGIFVDKAFFTLQGLESVPYTDDAFLVPFVDHVLHVYEEQACADYLVIIHRVLGELFIRDLHTHHKFRRNPYHRIPMDTKEDLDNFDQFLSLVAPSLSIDFQLILLVNRALSYIQRHKNGGDVDCELVTAAIVSVQANFRGHGGVEVDRDLLCNFLIHGASFLLVRSLQEFSHATPNPQGFASCQIKLLDFLNWALSLEWEREPNKTVFAVLRMNKTIVSVGLWITFYCRTIYSETESTAKNRPLWMREYIRVVYNGYPLREDEVEFLTDQMLISRDGTVGSPARRPPKTIQNLMDYSLSIEPYDHITLLRVFIAATTARSLGCPTAWGAYQLLMSKADLFNYIWLGATFQGHHPFCTDIPFEAISLALELGHDEQALEWLDQFSSMAWCRILHLRSSFTQVNAVDPQLAEELAAAGSDILNGPGGIGSTHEAEERYASCVTRWHSAVSNARKLPGFDRFLGPRVFAEIQSAVNILGGPVVYFNLNRYFSEALCVLPHLHDVLRIPLRVDYFAFNKVLAFFDCFIGGSGTYEIPQRGPGGRVGKLVKPNFQEPKNYISYPLALEYLWEAVVKPVLDGLGISRSEPTSAHNLPRIWWCPCGQMEALPLHAAGYYKNGRIGDNIMDYVVSSYIPSSSLVSHVTRDEVTTQKPHFLAVANPSHCRLPGTLKELKVLREHLNKSGTITELVGATATPDAVKRELHSTTWAHFACHGVQVEVQGRPEDNSSLILANHTRLPIAEIANLSLPQAQLAFLSACQTAQDLSICRGESAHIAGAMLVAGFRSVVGTMWRISDYYAPFLADNFYKNILDGKSVPDYRDSAYALHDAVKALREKNPDTTVWVPFLHFGA